MRCIRRPSASRRLPRGHPPTPAPCGGHPRNGEVSTRVPKRMCSFVPPSLPEGPHDGTTPEGRRRQGPCASGFRSRHVAGRWIRLSRHGGWGLPCARASITRPRRAACPDPRTTSSRYLLVLFSSESTRTVRKLWDEYVRSSTLLPVAWGMLTAPSRVEGVPPGGRDGWWVGVFGEDGEGGAQDLGGRGAPSTGRHLLEGLTHEWRNW
jgi:hypothetical protein